MAAIRASGGEESAELSHVVDPIVRQIWEKYFIKALYRPSRELVLQREMAFKRLVTRATHHLPTFYRQPLTVIYSDPMDPFATLRC